MFRIFRGFLAIKAAIAGVLILLVWVRSYIVADAFRKGETLQYIELSSASGKVIARFGHDGRETHLVGSWQRIGATEPSLMSAEAGLNGSAMNRIGFGYNKTLVGSPPQGVIVSVMMPHWFVFLLAIPSALRWLWRWSQNSAGAPSAGVTSWCPACWREMRGAVQVCPGCGGPMAVSERRAGARIISR